VFGQETLHELTTPRIAPLCDPLGSPIRFVEPDFPLFFGFDSATAGVNGSIAAQFVHSDVIGYRIIFVNLRLGEIPINKLAFWPYLGTFSRMKWCFG